MLIEWYLFVFTHLKPSDLGTSFLQQISPNTKGPSSGLNKLSLLNYIKTHVIRCRSD